jgi:hypothetical protein
MEVDYNMLVQNHVHYNMLVQNHVHYNMLSKSKPYGMVVQWLRT